MKNLLRTLLLAFAVQTAAAATPEARLAALGLDLPAVSPAIANYVPAVRSGNLVFLAGQVARDANGKLVTGKVGRDLTEAQAAEAARTCALQLLAALRAEIGDLAKVKRIVRVGGFVNCTESFTAQPQVVNGASDLLVAVFGEAGKHARTSVGVNALPAGAPVEIELIAEVEMER
ncbi:MAG TPA: RidA family protein [Lacunisphaera sp.]|jgi:enamine deaminase RidA (YjgF/YER057c/UK114 family)|nr:RidA family protein [Lacunisphaera sp.]HQY04553.1 RidA family protein [Lacunisphaera sp.]